MPPDATATNVPRIWGLVMVVSLVTKSVDVGRREPNVALEQSIWGDEIWATQCRAVATRFGARSEPEQNSVVVAVTCTTPTANLCVESVVPAWMGLEPARVTSGAGLVPPHATTHPAAKAPAHTHRLIDTRHLHVARAGSRPRGAIATDSDATS